MAGLCSLVELTAHRHEERGGRAELGQRIGAIRAFDIALIQQIANV
jgi:hypothetical protein